jgi:hypothetical protein
LGRRGKHTGFGGEARLKKDSHKGKDNTKIDLRGI